MDDGNWFEGSRLADSLGLRAMVLSNGTLFVDWTDYIATLCKDSPAIEVVERIKEQQKRG